MLYQTLLSSALLFSCGSVLGQPPSTSTMNQARLDTAYRCGIAASLVVAAAVEFPNDKAARLRVTTKLAKVVASGRSKARLLPTPLEVAKALIGVETMLENKRWNLAKPSDRDIIAGTAASICTIESFTAASSK